MSLTVDQTLTTADLRNKRDEGDRMTHLGFAIDDSGNVRDAWFDKTDGKLYVDLTPA